MRTKKANKNLGGARTKNMDAERRTVDGNVAQETVRLGWDAQSTTATFLGEIEKSSTRLKMDTTRYLAIPSRRMPRKSRPRQRDHAQHKQLEHAHQPCSGRQSVHDTLSIIKRQYHGPEPWVMHTLGVLPCILCHVGLQSLRQGG